MDDPEIAAIDATLKAQGKSRADLGRLLGLDSAQVSRMFNGRRKLQRHEHQQVVVWLGLDSRASAQPPATVISMPGMVPLFGGAGASSAERLTLAEAHMLGTVPMHPAQVNLRNAFAVRVHGDSMSPRYEPGEIVYVAPNQWPSKNQDCIIETAGSLGFLKRFIRRDEETLTAYQFNPEKEIEFAISEITAVHAVVGRG